MRVAMYYRNTDVRIQEMPIPKIGPGEILVKAVACGICGSDVLEWYRIKKAPLVLGHEMAGEIVQVDSQVQGYALGDRVFVSHHVPCNTCRHCLTGHRTACHTLHTTNYHPGGFAQFVQIPAINVDRGTFLLPVNLSYEEATLIEPMACVLRGQKSIHFSPGCTVLVIGSGIAGLLHVVLAKRLGAGTVIATDVEIKRLQYAQRLGADHVLLADEDIPSRLLEINQGRLADRVILCTGAPAAAQQALRCVERGGTLLFFAVPVEDIAVPINAYWRNDITRKTSYAGDPTDIQEAMDLLAGTGFPSGEIITHRLPLCETQEGFRLVSEAKESIKVIVLPNS